MEESKTQKNIQTSKFSQLLEIILYSLTTSSVFTVAKQSTLNTNHHLMADPFTKQASSELSLIICLGTNLSSVAKLAFFWLSVWICRWSLNQTGESNYLITQNESEPGCGPSCCRLNQQLFTSSHVKLQTNLISFTKTYF